MQIHDRNTYVFHAQQPCLLQGMQGVVNALPRQPGKMADFLLRDVEVVIRAWVKLRIKKGRQALCDPGFRVTQPIAVQQGDHLRESLV